MNSFLKLQVSTTTGSARIVLPTGIRNLASGILFALPILTHGLSVGGYLENRSSSVLATDEVFTSTANIRVEGDKDITEKSSLQAHIVLQSTLAPIDPFFSIKPGSRLGEVMAETTTGLTQSLGLADDSTGRDLADLLGSDMINYFPYSTLYPQNQVNIDRALIRISFKNLDLSLGKQQMGWGTGYAFNPTDIWNTKSPLDVSAPRIGVPAARFEYTLGSLSSLDVILAPGRDMETSSAGVRVKSNLLGTDFSLNALRSMNADRKLYGLPVKLQAGFDLAGQFPGEIGFWSETAFINPVSKTSDVNVFDSSYAQIDAGLDYTFEGGWYIMSEYYFNGLGSSSAAGYSSTDLLYIFTGDMSGYGKQYLMSGIRKTIFDYWTLSLFSLNNLNDASLILMPGVGWDINDDIALNLDGFINIGDEADSEFGSMYSTVQGKIKAYF